MLICGRVNHAHSIRLKHVTVQVNSYINRSCNNNVAVFLYITGDTMASHLQFILFIAADWFIPV